MNYADDKLPQWIRLRTNDWDSPAGRYILAGGRTADWADYGRWFALRQLLATTPGACIDASSQRQLGSLARQLGFGSARACREWLDALAECDAISAGEWEGTGLVVDVDVVNQQASYQSRVRVNRANRGGCGKGRETPDEPATKGRRIVNESCDEGATNA